MKYYEEYKGFTNEELVFLAQEGNEDAKKYLVKKNQPFINMFVQKYTKNKYTQEYDDLYSEACIGFMQAVNRFDTTKGFKFNTYAGSYIDGSIKLALRSTVLDGKCYRVGRDQAYAYKRAGKVEAELEQKLGRTPTLEEIAKEMDMDIRKLADIIIMNKEHGSLDDTKWQNDKKANGDILVEDSVSDKKIKTENEIIRDIIIDDAISKLSPKRQFILRKLYWEGYTQAEVAEMTGVTQCLISREKRLAVKMLRSILAKELDIPKLKPQKKTGENGNKAVRCITTGEIFESIRQAEKHYGIYRGGISRNVNGIQYMAGRHPETKEPLRWEMVD